VPIFLGRIVNIVLAGGPKRSLYENAALMVFTGTTSALVTGLSRWYVSKLAGAVCADLRERAMRSALEMEAVKLEAAGAGDVAARITEDVDAVSRSILLISTVFNAAVAVAVASVGFLYLDWRLAAGVLVVIPVYVISLRRFSPEARLRYAVERHRSTVRSAALLETFTGTETLAAYGSGELQAERVELASHSSVVAQVATQKWFGWFANSMNYAEAIGLVSVLSVGFLLVQSGSATVGDVTSAALMFHRLFAPLGSILLGFNDMQSASVAFGRLVGVSLMAPPTYSAADGLTPAVDVAPPVRAKAVSHRYTETEPMVLVNVNVEVAGGTSLAIVGASGAGKSTLAAVLSGVTKPTSGAAYIGEDAVLGMPPTRRKTLIGVATQDLHVFSGTLLSDLRLAAPTATSTEVWDALHAAEATEWVKRLDDGILTVVGAGGKELSTTQCQQVALARLFLLDPKVVILDESTAEGGSAGSKVLERASARLIHGRTAIVIAHRLSQAARCDRVLVLDAGQVAEYGSHSELLAADGIYGRLWRAWTDR
jgi:ATP-binding cassette subfamily C protein